MSLAQTGPTTGYRTPDAQPRGVFRCKNGLAATTATSSGGVLYELIPVHGSARMRVYIKTATNGGTLDAFTVGPDFDVALASKGDTAYASLTGTIHTTGNMTQVAVSAGTEASGTLDLYGAGYVLLKFTGTVGAGTITYVDVEQL